MSKWALITGCARRIGRAIALELASAGYDVVVHYNKSQADAETLAEEVQALGRQACMAEIDLANHAAVERLIPSLTTEIGPLAVLVNNASLFERDADDPDGSRHMAVNAEAPKILGRSFYRVIREHNLRQERSDSPPLAGGGSTFDPGASGIRTESQGLLHAPPPNLPRKGGGTPTFLSSLAIINLLDGSPPIKNFEGYIRSKDALHALTLETAREFAPHVRVNGVAPGPTLPSPRQSDEHFRQLVTQTPMQKQVAPQDVAMAVRFLAENSSITGEIIRVDGGAHLLAAAKK